MCKSVKFALPYNPSNYKKIHLQKKQPAVDRIYSIRPDAPFRPQPPPPPVNSHIHLFCVVFNGLHK